MIGMRARIARTTRGPTGSRSGARSMSATSRSWRSADAVYPCFCTPLELEASRRAQLAVGQAAALCGHLPRAFGRAARAEARAGHRADHCASGCRSAAASSSWTSCTGRRAFLSDDIGDFVVRRADGSAAFFFCNAVDDADMGVTHVLRGEDHLTNTPRQLLILEALGSARRRAMGTCR